jgi:hypothetical protein
MSESFEPDQLDATLRQALRARPEPPMAIDLASRAIARAATSREALAELARVRRWNRALTALAAILIIALAAWVIHTRLAAGGFQDWSDSTATSTNTTAMNGGGSSTVSDNSTNAMQWMFLGAAMAVGAVVVVAMQRALGATDEWMIRWARN